MLNLTREESKVILFLVFAILLGLGVSYAAKTSSGFKTAAQADLKIAKFNLNQAGLEEILKTGCVPPKLAERIIRYRDEHGSFDSIEQLKQVKGVKDSRIRKLEKVFFVE
ncbi:MAG: helix-hairpin-helix domain-containing protein [Candidatus Omnitrophota bacterium]|jgi:competence ComEA-like helix-hairpin-helix protein